MYGIDPHQFKKHIVVPTLMRIGLLSDVAGMLTLGTCLKESLLKYVIQRPNGPALGVGQMEPFTHDDIWKTYLEFRPQLACILRVIAGKRADSLGMPLATELIGNLNYAVAMTRIRYYRVQSPLPAAIPLDLTLYWKNHYNTLEGKGEVNEALPHFKRAVEIWNT